MKKVRGFINKSSCYFCAVMSWGLMVWLYWILEYKTYEGNLDIDFVYALIYPPAFIILILFANDTQKSTKQRSKMMKKIRNIIDKILLIAFLVLTLWYIIFVNPYFVVGYQYLVLLFVAELFLFFTRSKQFDKPNKKGAIWLVTISTWILTIILFFFLLVVDPITVKQGQQLVTDNGYYRVQYMNSIKSATALNMVFPDAEINLLKHEEGMNFYLYMGEKDGRSYAIAVSLVEKRIVGEAVAHSNSMLSAYLSNYSRGK